MGHACFLIGLTLLALSLTGVTPWASVPALFFIIVALILNVGPKWHRLNQEAQEVGRDPMGRHPETPDERLARVERPRRAWASAAALAAASAGVTGWFVWQAVGTGERGYVGLAIMFAAVALPMLWVTWKTGQLLHRREGNRPSSPS